MDGAISGWRDASLGLGYAAFFLDKANSIQALSYASFACEALFSRPSMSRR
jgi:hypothetical protein